MELTDKFEDEIESFKQNIIQKLLKSEEKCTI